MTHAVVVGAGLFGCTIARALKGVGMGVTVLDDGRPLSGSKPSGSLMKPSWFAGLGKDVHDPALETLEDIYGLEELDFRIRPSGVQQKVYRIPTKKILDHEGLNVHSRTVTSVGSGYVEWRDDPFGTVQRIETNLVVLAAGVWCSQLLYVPGLQGRQGVSFGWDGRVEENFIRPWAPYKQAVAFNDTNVTTWAGDGTAIKPENWTAERQEKSLHRMAEYCDRAARKARQLTGIRPYLKGVKPCLLEERAPGLWLATGGAKNGLIAAGWCAHEIVKTLE